MKSSKFRIGAIPFLLILFGALAENDEKDAPAEGIYHRVMKGESSLQKESNDQQQASSESTEYAAAVSMAHEKAPVTLTDEQYHNLVHIKLPGSNKTKRPKTTLTIEKLKRKGYSIESYDKNTGIVTLRAKNSTVSNSNSQQHVQPQTNQNSVKNNTVHPLQPLTPPIPVQPITTKPIIPILPPQPIQPVISPKPIEPTMGPIMPTKPVGPLTPPNPLGPIITATQSPEVTTQRIISHTPSGQPPLIHDPVGLRVLVTSTISPTPSANYETTTHRIYKTKVVEDDSASQNTVNCPNFQQFINGSIELWNGLKNSDKVKDGFDLVSHTALDAFSAISHCVIKIFSDIGGWFGSVPSEIANSFHGIWKTQNSSAPEPEEDKSNLPTPVRIWKKVPSNMMTMTPPSSSEKEAPMHVHQGELRIAQGQQGIAKTDSIFKRKDLSPPPLPEGENADVEQKELNKRESPAPLESLPDEQKTLLEKFKSLFSG